MLNAIDFYNNLIILNKKNYMKHSRGTEIKIPKFTNYNVSFGAINKLNPKSLYIKLTAWALPISTEDKNYKILIRKINKQIKTKMYFHLNGDNFNVHKTMVHFNMRESGIKYGKASFMNCEITLFQLNNHLLKSDILMKDLIKITDLIINEILEDNEIFNFYKRKTLTKNKIKKLNLVD